MPVTEAENAELLETLEMVENRLECALMGELVCRGCVDVALSYVKDIIAAERVRANANQTGDDKGSR